MEGASQLDPGSLNLAVSETKSGSDHNDNNRVCCANREIHLHFERSTCFGEAALPKIQVWFNLCLGSVDGFLYPSFISFSSFYRMMGFCL